MIAVPRSCTRLWPCVVMAASLARPSHGADTATDDARQMINAGEASSDTPSKLRCFTEAIRLAPTLVEAWVARAKAYLDAGRYDAALRDASEAIDLNPARWTPWAIRAETNMKLRRHRAAASDATDAIRLRPGHAGLHTMRAEVYRRMNLLDDAIEEASTALLIDRRSRDALATRAAALAARGRYELALGDLNSAISLHDQYPFAIHERARVLASLGQYHEAIADCDRLATLQPTKPEPLLLKAGILSDQGRFEEAQRAMSRAFMLGAREPKVWLQMASVQSQAKRWREALASCDRAIALSPGYALAFASRAETYRAMRDFGQALKESTKALELDPECVQAHATRGAAHMAIEDWDAALDDLSAAVERDPTHRFSLKLRARVYTIKREWGRALADAEALVKLAGNNREKADAYLVLGATYRDKGLFEQAIQVLSEAVKMAPRRSHPYFRRANAYRMAGKPKQAIPDCDAGLKLEPTSAFGQLLRGVCYFQMEDFAAARKDITRADAIDERREWESWVNAYLAEIARQEKRYRDAIRFATTALSTRPKIAHPMAYVVRAASRRQKAYYLQAIDDATRAIELRKGFAYAFAERGASRRALHDYDAAIEDCNRAISFLPFLDLAYHERAYSMLSRYRGEGTPHVGAGAALPAIITGLGGLDVPFELAKSISVRPESAGTGTANAVVIPERPYTPEPVAGAATESQSHPLDRAVSDFLMLLRTGYSAASSAAGLSQCLGELERFQEAKAVCDREIDRADESSLPDLYVARSMVLYALGQTDGGLEDARRAVSARPDEAAPRLVAAYGLALKDKWPECRANCEAALKQTGSLATRSRAMLLWCVADQQARVPTPVNVKALTQMAGKSHLGRTEWPTPLLSAIARSKALDAFAARVTALDEATVLKRRLCQVHYYFGMIDIGAGRLALGKEKLKRAVSLGSGQIIEFSLANATLQRFVGP